MGFQVRRDGAPRQGSGAVVQLTIIGAGAIGGTIGAHLIRDGHDILLCDADVARGDFPVPIFQLAWVNRAARALCDNQVMRELSATAAAVAQRLRAEVLSGELRAGARVKEEALADRFRVGRYTARSALQTLVAARLLEHEANRGARVPVLEPARVDELYEYRTILELGGLRLALARGMDLTAVEDATAALRQLPADSPWPDVIETHQQVHGAFVQSSGNARLIEAYRVCEDELEFVIASTRPDYTQQRLAALHIHLLERLRAGGEAAVAALADDIEIGRRAVHEAMPHHAPAE
jgi:DNA-binding GntR family transcriptional regulator